MPVSVKHFHRDSRIPVPHIFSLFECLLKMILSFYVRISTLVHDRRQDVCRDNYNSFSPALFTAVPQYECFLEWIRNM